MRRPRRPRLPRGLSPRVRGNPGGGLVVGSPVRSIPACAGEPLSAVGRRWPGRVYPRVCGGTGMVHRYLSAMGGLSPRVRGNQKVPEEFRQHIGSIPACAGEPRRPLGTLVGVAVYPRVCGGTCCPKTILDTPAGLSPRVRGNRPAPTPPTPKPRSIPACAGEPDQQVAGVIGQAVYPRVCGGTPSPSKLPS